MEPVSAKRFDRIVSDRLLAIPDEIADALDNVVIRVQDDHPDGLLGLYEGTPLSERETYGTALELPDIITIYRLPLCEIASDEADLEREVTVTVIHELAHHLGIDDARLDELGWS